MVIFRLCKFLQDACPIADLEKTLAGVSKVERMNLSVTELQKLKLKAEAGLENKFMLMAPLVDTKANKDQLESIYPITMWVGRVPQESPLFPQKLELSHIRNSKIPEKHIFTNSQHA